MLNRLVFFSAAACSLAGCIVVDTTFTEVPPGPWRGVFYLDGRLNARVEPDAIAEDYNLQDVNRGELPVNLEFSYRDDSTLLLTLINGEERIAVDDITFARELSTARDTITVRFPLNDTYLTGYHEGGIIEGYFVDETREGGAYSIPFAAFHGVGYRFTELRKEPVTDLTGRWATEFGIDDSTRTEAAIAEFEQDGNHLTATFLTPTGDYRYLEGTIQADRFYLSTFDGEHVYLFSGKVLPDSSLIGLFRSGRDYQSIWTARRDADASLPLADEATRVLEPGAPVSLSATLPDGGALRVADLPGQLKVLTIMGSWCPNCKDEALFLDSLRATLPPGAVSFAGLAFERFRDTTRALAAIERFGERLDLGFPIALAGFADKAEATARLGFLDEVRSFPTLVVLDTDDRVVYTHTGFAGPATSAYGDFTRAFAKTLQDRLPR